ncbi:serine hydroxymethyltransferase [Candidatus Woesearchaeota archaeon]|nr:serine hydroxymethyltransferase [Candidatus Woesearchaeota archaeon]
MAKVIIIAALDENRVIGNKKSLPWRIPGDFRHFKDTTDGHAVIMGRTTFESLGKPLPNRMNIVLTSRPFNAPGVSVSKDLRSAIITAAAQGYGSIFLIGGASVYAEGLQYADEMILSHIPGTHEGDTFFPQWDAQQWQMGREQQREGFAVRWYNRISNQDGHAHTATATPAAAAYHPAVYPALSRSDPELHQHVIGERRRQQETLNMIPSENYVSPAVLEASGSVLANKYAEGYPKKRYYQGNANVDEVEQLAIDRAKRLFGAEHANVQPYSGSPANMAVYFALLNPGDTILGMKLDMGGHLTHGHSVNFSGKLYNIVQYGVDRETGLLDMEEIRELALQHRPKISVSGATAYPRIIDFKKFHDIAKEVGAYSFADISHIAGLIVGGAHPSPFPFTDVVMTTTHKTLRGPRGAMILCKEAYAKAIDKAVFPGLQGGPHMNTIAAKAAAFNEALQPQFRDYAQQIVRNAKALASTLMDHGLTLVSGGTDNHLLLADLTSQGVGLGRKAAVALEEAGIVMNANTIPYDQSTPFSPSGLRMGTPILTTRGMKEEEMRQVGEWIAAVVNDMGNTALQQNIRKSVVELCSRFPVYPAYGEGC